MTSCRCPKYPVCAEYISTLDQPEEPQPAVVNQVTDHSLEVKESKRHCESWPERGQQVTAPADKVRCKHVPCVSESFSWQCERMFDGLQYSAPTWMHDDPVEVCQFQVIAGKNMKHRWPQLIARVFW